MVKIGDKVRFIVDEPSHGAVYFNGTMNVIAIYEDEEDGTIVVLRYPAFDDWSSGLVQDVSLTDVERV